MLIGPCWKLSGGSWNPGPIGGAPNGTPGGGADSMLIDPCEKLPGGGIPGPPMLTGDGPCGSPDGKGKRGP